MPPLPPAHRGLHPSGACTQVAVLQLSIHGRFASDTKSGWQPLVDPDSAPLARTSASVFADLRRFHRDLYEALNAKRISRSGRVTRLQTVVDDACTNIPTAIPDDLSSRSTSTRSWLRCPFRSAASLRSARSERSTSPDRSSDRSSCCWILCSFDCRDNACVFATSTADAAASRSVLSASEIIVCSWLPVGIICNSRRRRRVPMAAAVSSAALVSRSKQPSPNEDGVLEEEARCMALR